MSLIFLRGVTSILYLPSLWLYLRFLLLLASLALNSNTSRVGGWGGGLAQFERGGLGALANSLQKVFIEARELERECRARTVTAPPCVINLEVFFLPMPFL
jgi:hypothetical protein